MQLGSYYEEMIKVFDESMNSVFGGNIIKTDMMCDVENSGFSRIKYAYPSLNFTLLVENEFRTFDITFFDEEQASNSLYRITKFNNQLDKKSIFEAVKLLKTILEQGDYNLYFQKSGKLYRKNQEGEKRVKDIREMLNG